MKPLTLRLRRVLPVALACLMCRGQAIAGIEHAAPELSGLVARFAASHGIKQIAVLDFDAVGEADKAQTRRLSEKVSSGLHSGSGDSGLKRILAKARKGPGGTQALAAGLKRAFAADAMLTGTVFGVGGRVRISARLIDVKTGRTLYGVAGISAGERAASAREMELPGFPGPYPWDMPEEIPAPPSDLRDAVSGYRDDVCAEEALKLAKQNSELVDAKARYWAEELKKPGFAERKLRRNPGIEIAAPSVRAKFYELLADYYAAPSSGLLSVAVFTELMDLMNDEARHLGACGKR